MDGLLWNKSEGNQRAEVAWLQQIGENTAGLWPEWQEPAVK
jgi:hypothetical protein